MKVKNIGCMTCELIFYSMLGMLITKKLHLSSCFCSTQQCNNFHDELQKQKNASEATKLKIMTIYKEHLDLAKMQRQYYNYWRSFAKLNSELEDGDTFSVLSFDFAQSWKFPNSPQQVGSSYFKSPRSCSIFGVHDERTEKQVNFLIDEGESVGKGANSVISMLHEYLESCNAQVLILFSDNCVGQNKNNALMEYLQWRVVLSKN